MTTKTRIKRLEAERAAADWREFLPAGVSIEAAEREKFALAKVLANYAAAHDIEDVSAIPRETVEQLFSAYARGLTSEPDDMADLDDE